MRQFRRVIIGLILLLGSWLVWRQVGQRLRTRGQNTYAPRSPLPEWSAAPMPTPDPSVVTGTAEQTHNQTDTLTQPQEPAAPMQEHSGASFAVDTALGSATDSKDNETHTEAEETAAPDDLIRIEGIGPKVSTVMVAAGITTFAQLEETGVEQLRTILAEANIHTLDPTTWPQQAGLAAQGKWAELQELQDRIKNGRLEA